MADNPSGTSRDYILSRLKREKLDHFIDAIEAGQVSAYAVAADLGWVGRPAVLGTGSVNQAKRRAHRLGALQAETGGALPDLTSDEVLELWLGPSPQRGALFRTREELQAAWVRGRDYVMAQWARGGRRPMGWWEFEAPIPFPGLDRQASTLYASGILDDAEKAELEAEWREDFDDAQDPEFVVCLGPGEVLTGRAARRVHYRDADIPHALVKRWTTEHRRQARTIRHLEAMAGG
jgi:hypothetical protein